jgi:hypothetical protein
MHTRPYEHAHITLPLGAFRRLGRQILKIDEVTTNASLSTGTRLTLKAQTLLDPEKFAHTKSRTQELRCHRSSYNH